MRYVSVCAGIEAATVAWHPLGWEPAAFSEIDGQARAVLSHRFPDVPLVGDFRDIKGDEHGTVDLLVGGTPCQSFSVAGKRGGIKDPRGHLALEFPRLGRRLGVHWIVWENVPGVLSDDKGYTFRRVVAEFRKCGFHVAWRKLDTQHVRVDGHERAVPQRRQRVFLVGHSGEWALPPAVLFEPEGGERGSPPRREAGKAGGVAPQAPALAARAAGGGGLGTDFDLDGGLIPETAAALVASMGPRSAMPNTGVWNFIPEVCPTLDDRDRSPSEFEVNGGLVPEVSGSVSSKWAKGSGGPAGDEAYNLVPVAVSLRGRDGGADMEVERDDVSPALRASQGGGDKQHVLEPVAFDCRQSDVCVYGDVAGAVDTTLPQQAVAIEDRATRDVGNGLGINDSGAAYTLDVRSAPQAVAFSCKDHGADAREEVSPTLRAMPHDGSHMNGGGQVAVATEMRVRRITCVEAERLQGFPDNHTLVPRFPGDTKGMSNSARYKLIGNAMSVNVMRWIGRRIELVERIRREGDSQ